MVKHTQTIRRQFADEWTLTVYVEEAAWFGGEGEEWPSGLEGIMKEPEGSWFNPH